MPFDSAPAAAHVNVDCLLCPVKSCLGRQAGDVNAGAWAAMLAPRVAVMPGAPPLFNAGSRLQSLYSVRAGCIKTYTVDAEGTERIRGFYLPGDLIGLDVLGRGVWQSSAAAVEPSQVCVAPVAALRSVVTGQPALAQRLMEQTSRELAQALALSGDFTAEQRLAAFLLQMEQRLHSREGLLRLPMPQRDIGNYLRLATETVCRTLKAFAAKGWVRHESKGLRLVAPHKLRELAEPVGFCAEPLSLAA
ncbi:MAG: helix-turn-helix domain-containing protein [Nevskia sp.]|nr:helix-turn-helix domain-containing protein [Nevskia sp.]